MPTPETTTFSMLRAEAVIPAAALTLLLFTIFGATWEASPIDTPTQSAILFGWIFAILVWASFGVVRHAEGLATILGEPIGTILLTLSVISIEVAMITAVTLTGEHNPTLARDTMFSVLMIVLNALVGVSLIVGGLKHHSQLFSLRGAKAYLGALFTLAGLGLILPRFTPSTPDGSPSTLLASFLLLVSAVVYGIFLTQQTVSHQSLFQVDGEAGAHDHGHTVHSVKFHAALLVGIMLLIVFLSKHFAVFVESGVSHAGLPPALGGILVAIIVLTPEGLAAVHAAAENNIQRSINICLGSGLATIGLTIPAILGVSLFTGRTMELGLETPDIVMLAITMIVSMTTFAAGRTTYLQGCLHLVLFLGYLMLVFD
ncbi:MAG: calcium:proton antiporter [Candidatus Binatia bacterium]|nr:calcium:proton antiporter [Candidatus Binatia bacterium]MDG1959263.1 calcium:proton antiporter [Candidatus Binatia bacterium]MDG2008736.1 calcium:proton antiporter [Candidatus Binatia bacterium]HAC79226.1 calcium:proton antiporter [Deltaproteobacteria bacterium]